MVEVCASNQLAVVTASRPQDSEVQALEKPSASASRTSATRSWMVPGKLPTVIPSFLFYLIEDSSLPEFCKLTAYATSANGSTTQKCR